jgi:hypothetical protein
LLRLIAGGMTGIELFGIDFSFLSLPTANYFILSNSASSGAKVRGGLRCKML